MIMQEKDTTVKKQSRRGGFDVHPENINKEGRPDTGFTWKELFMRKAQEKKKQLERRELVANAVWNRAEEGDIPAFKEIRDTMDGKPLQKSETDVTSKGEKIQGFAVELVHGKANDTNTGSL